MMIKETPVTDLTSDPRLAVALTGVFVTVELDRPDGAAVTRLAPLAAVDVPVLLLAGAAVPTHDEPQAVALTGHLVAFKALRARSITVAG